MAQHQVKHVYLPSHAPEARSAEEYGVAAGQGPVAALQNLIYQRFASDSVDEALWGAGEPVSKTVDTIISAVSRAAGPALFFAALAALAIAIF